MNAARNLASAAGAIALAALLAVLVAIVGAGELAHRTLLDVLSAGPR